MAILIRLGRDDLAVSLQRLISSRLKVISFPPWKPEHVQKQVRRLQTFIFRLLSSLDTSAHGLFERDGRTVILDTGELWIQNKKVSSPLKGRPLETLRILVRNTGRWVGNDEIVRSIDKSAYKYKPIPKRAHNYVQDLRKKPDYPTFILGKRGTGYMIPKL